MMDIRINKPREIQSRKSAPEPTQRARKKIVQKINKGPITTRRFFSAVKVFAKVAGVLLIAFFILSIFVYALTSDRFNLQTITFHGCKQSDPKKLEKIIRRDFPANTLRIDLQRLEKRLEKDPWIKNAGIRRILPSDIVIYVQERSPSAILELNGELMIADSDGTLLDVYDPRYGKLDAPVIKGFLGEDPEGYRRNYKENAARVRQAQDMLSEIESGLPSYTQKISEIDISDPNNLKILLVDDCAVIYLGDKDYLKRFNKLMDNMTSYQEVKNQFNNDIVWVELRIAGKIIYHHRDDQKKDYE
jgi:cell division septal protein FtsQ